MAPRSINTLLQIVIESLEKGDKKGFNNTGICSEIKGLEDVRSIYGQEGTILLSFLRRNKPVWVSDVSGFWWETMDIDPSTRQTRIKFLKNLIR